MPGGSAPDTFRYEALYAFPFDLNRGSFHYDKKIARGGLHIRAMTDSRPMPIKLDVTRFEDISVPAEVRTDTNSSSTMPVFMLASPMNQNHLSLFRTVALAGGSIR